MASLENFKVGPALDFSAITNAFRNARKDELLERQLGIAEAQEGRAQQTFESGQQTQDLKSQLFELLNPQAQTPQEEQEVQEPQIIKTTSGIKDEPLITDKSGLAPLPAQKIINRDKALSLAARIDPQTFNAVKSLFEFRDEQKLKAFNLERERQQANALLLKGKPFEEKRKILRDMQSRFMAKNEGQMDPEIDKMLRMEPGPLNIEVQRDLLIGDALKKAVENSLDVPDPQSKIGKLVADKTAAVSLFGADSPQAKAIQEVITAETAGEKPKLSDEKGMRGDFTGLSGDFVKLGDNFKKINAARSTPAGDVSLIFNFMKMLDPTSVVREGEQATAAAAGPLVDRATLGAYNKAVLGTKLLSEQRADFKAEAQNIFASQMGAQLRREREFTDIAKRAGIDPRNVVLDFIGPFRKVGGKKKIGRFSVEEE